MQASIGADLELEQRLDRYAQVRLTPSAASVARTRARVMREARLGFAAMAEPRPAVPVVEFGGPIARRNRRKVLRRAGGLLVAAALSLGVVGGAMAASRAGGPLYDTRVWLEALTLPSDPGGRADGEVARLEARLEEVLVAARSGDPAAVDAALDAYESIAAEAVAGAGANVAALEVLRQALDRHVAVLQLIAAKVPSQARDAIERNIDRAIERNGATLERIDAATPPPAVGPSTVKPQAGKTPKPTQAAQPATTPKPARTPRPPAPTPVVPEPQATDAPQGPPSEKPAKTPPAHGSGGSGSGGAP